MNVIHLADARARKQARALRAKRKEIADKHKLPVVRLFRAVGVAQSPGTVILQAYGDVDMQNLIAVAKLDNNSIEELVTNIKAAAGMKEMGLLWTP